MIPALPATAAEQEILSYSVPQGTETVWIDIEAPEVNLSNTDAETGDGSSWTDLALRDTAFGISAIIPVQSGQLNLRLDSTLRSNADVSLSFAGADNTLIRVDSQRIPLSGGTGAAPSPSPSGPAPGGGNGSTEPAPGEPSAPPTTAPGTAPSQDPGSSPKPSATSSVPPQDLAPSGSPSAAPGPASSSAVAVPPAGDGADPGNHNPVNPQTSGGSNLPSTGWTPLLLITALGLLAAGSVIVLSAARRKGAHQ